MGAFFILLPAQVGDFVPQEVIRAQESLFGHRIMVGYFQSHAGVLGALPWKDESDFFSIHFTLGWIWLPAQSQNSSNSLGKVVN
jgi:hypothetical protein